MKDKVYIALMVLAFLTAPIFLAGCEGRSIETAIPLELGTKVEGVLRSGSPTYYKFSAKAETLYQVLVRESLLVRLTLMTEEGKILDYQFDAAKAFWPGISFLADGAYILRVEAATHAHVEYPAYSDPEMLYYELMVRVTPGIQTAEEADFFRLIRDGAAINGKIDFFDQPRYYRIDVPAIITGENAVNRYHVRIDTLEYAPRVVIEGYDQERQFLGTYLNRFVVDARERAQTYYLLLWLNYDDVRNEVSWEYAQTDYAIVYQKIPILGLSPAIIEMPASGGTAEIHVHTTTGSPVGKYSSHSTREWISIISDTEGRDTGTVVISITPNQSIWGRIGRVEVWSQYGGRQYVEVRQSGA